MNKRSRELNQENFTVSGVDKTHNTIDFATSIISSNNKHVTVDNREIEENEMLSTESQDYLTTAISSPPSKRKKTASVNVNDSFLPSMNISSSQLEETVPQKQFQDDIRERSNRSVNYYVPPYHQHHHQHQQQAQVSENHENVFVNDENVFVKISDQSIKNANLTLDQVINNATGIKNDSQSDVKETQVTENTQSKQSTQQSHFSSTISSFSNSNRKLKTYSKISKKKSKHTSTSTSTTSYETIVSSDSHPQTRINEQSLEQIIEQHQKELKNIEETKKYVQDFNENFQKTPYFSSLFEIFNEIIDELTIEVCHEVHRKVKTGKFCLNCCCCTTHSVNEQNGVKNKSKSSSVVNSQLSNENVSFTEQPQHQPLFHNNDEDQEICQIKDNPNNYESNLIKNETTPMVLCDNGCGRYIAAHRYAPHLEKCMGLKLRNRRRAISLNVGETTEKKSHTANSGDDGSSHTSNKNGEDDNNAVEIEDFEDDTFDISAEKNLQKTKPKKNTQTSRDSRSRQSQIQALIESLKKNPRSTLEKLLATKCCVISLKTGRMCTKSLKCPQHTEEQRVHIRRELLFSGDSTSVSMTNSETGRDNSSLQDEAHNRTETNDSILN